MDETVRTAVRQRLSSTAGHMKGIERMVQADAACLDVMQQIQAVQAALAKVCLLLLDHHLHTCLATAVRHADARERERVLRDVTAVFALSHKFNLSTQRRFDLMNSKTFTVPNISCGHCTHTIEMEVGELPGVNNVTASQDSKQVTVTWEAPATWDQIQATLQEINYPPEGLIQIS